MNKWIKYQKETFERPVNALVKDFLTEYQVKQAIDLGCGSGNETVYLIKKGIKVLSIDNELNENYILDRLTPLEQKQVKFLKNTFEEVELPKTDLIIACFSLPFCKPSKFNQLWQKIYDALNNDGYFVGQLFGDKDDWHKIKSINTFDKETVLKYLSSYQIIKFAEVEYSDDKKKWHYYDIIARKSSKS